MVRLRWTWGFTQLPTVRGRALILSLETSNLDRCSSVPHPGRSDPVPCTGRAGSGCSPFWCLRPDIPAWHVATADSQDGASKWLVFLQKKCPKQRHTRCHVALVLCCGFLVGARLWFASSVAWQESTNLRLGPLRHPSSKS